MKRFLLNVLLFVIISAVIVSTIGSILYFFISQYGRNFLNNADYKVTQSIIRSRDVKKVRKLVVGDSVSASLYGECSDSAVYCLSATVALTTVGHYLLCANFFEHNKDQLPEEVVLILNPICWKNTMSGGLFYSTFMKNFYNDEFQPFLDEDEIDYLDGETFSSLCNMRWYQLSPYVPNVHQVQPNGDGISPVQYKYVYKMKTLCERSGVKFRLLSGPMRKSLQDEVNRICKSDVAFSEPLFQDYFDSVKYMDDENFVDQLHLKTNCIPVDYFNLYD